MGMQDLAFFGFWSILTVDLGLTNWLDVASNFDVIRKLTVKFGFIMSELFNNFS